MSALSVDIAALEAAVAALGPQALSVGGLDGLLAAVAVCPEAVPPEEWLARVWVIEDEDDEVPVEETPETVAAVSQIILRFEQVAAELERGVFAPLYDVDERIDDTLWELWAEGFEIGMSLRPDAWLPLLVNEDDASEALRMLIGLMGIANGDPEIKAELGAEAVEEATTAAPDLLPECVQVLYDAQRPPQQPIVRGPKIGRNDPCPCGSGKKHKKCCGARG